jgi:hypothetical protein
MMQSDQLVQFCKEVKFNLKQVRKLISIMSVRPESTPEKRWRWPEWTVHMKCPTGGRNVEKVDNLDASLLAF